MTIGRIPSVEGGIQPTIVDAKGDLIAATAADTVNRLAVGSNDQVLVADSAASTGLAWKSYGSQLSSSNPVLNGAFDIWQRGTSFANPTSSATAYSADRWQTFRGGYASGITTSRQTTSDTTNLPNIQYCTRIQRNSGNSALDIMYALTNFETVNSIPYAGKTVTLSFYARAGANYSSASSALGVRLASGTGTDENYISGSFTGNSNLVNASATLTTTWQRFTYTATVGTTATQLAIRFDYTPVGTASTNDYFEVTGVQLDVGSVATPFRRTGGTIQGELAACQRYYVRFTGANFSRLGMGFARSATQAELLLIPPVSLRTIPGSLDQGGSHRLVNGTSGYAITAGTITLAGGEITTDKVLVLVTSSGLTTNNVYFTGSDGSSSAYIGLSAEL